MKKTLVVLFVVAALLFASNAFAAPKKANLGSCVSECLHGLDARAGYCTDYCKGDLADGDVCGPWSDGCCNSDYQSEDPDCEVATTSDLPTFGQFCNPGEGCAAGSTCRDISGGAGTSYRCLE